MSLTSRQLVEIMPQVGAEGVARWLEPLNDMMEVYAITTPMRCALFLATIAVESQELTHLVENLHYSSAMRLRYVFPTHFATDDEALPYVENPQATANHVYASRLGNGPEASGDGWKYRGRGLIQLTGRDEYAAYGKYKQLPTESHPEMLELPQYAADSAGWFWAEYKGCNTVADLGSLAMVTRKVNGGLTDWAARQAFFRRAREAYQI